MISFSYESIFDRSPVRPNAAQMSHLAARVYWAGQM